MVTLATQYGATQQIKGGKLLQYSREEAMLRLIVGLILAVGLFTHTAAQPLPERPQVAPVQRPIAPRVDTPKQDDAALKLCRDENRKLKDQVSNLERDLKDAKAKLASTAKATCLADDVARDASGKVRACGAYACFNGKCNTGCNNSTWCSTGYACIDNPRPGRCCKVIDGKDYCP